MLTSTFSDNNNNKDYLIYVISFSKRKLRNSRYVQNYCKGKTLKLVAPAYLETNKQTLIAALLVDCSQSPIFPLYRRCRSLSLTSRHLGFLMPAKLGKMPLGRGGGGQGGRPFVPTLLTQPPLPTDQFIARIKRPRWRPVELNDRHLRCHGKIGDCEQSTRLVIGSKEKSTCGF